MTSGSTGSRYRPTAEIADRLARWRNMATRGAPVNDIAAALGIPRATLDQSVCRARRLGHPDAVLHPDARVPGEGVNHIRDGAARARRIQRRAQEHR